VFHFFEHRYRLRIFIGPWEGAMSTGDDSVTVGKKQRVLRISVLCDQDCRHAGLTLLKALTVNLSWWRPSIQHVTL